MKYILKYRIKSRYFGFFKEYYKEFDNPYKIYEYIKNNNFSEWKIYQRTQCNWMRKIK